MINTMDKAIERRNGFISACRFQATIEGSEGRN